VLRWLTRLFRQREAAEAAPAEAPPPPTPPVAISETTTRDAVAPADVDTVGPDEIVAVETSEILSVEPAVTVGEGDLSAGTDLEGKETCPTCGRTSVFAGPPGQRFCTYCALRGELFEASAAASE
jgi:hypothetical protein